MLRRAWLRQPTPLYKARFEELPEQGQIVFDALALHWHPAIAADIAAAARLEVHSVSTQLTRLHEDGQVEKVDLPDSARQGFQLAERFFNSNEHTLADRPPSPTEIPPTPPNRSTLSGLIANDRIQAAFDIIRGRHPSARSPPDPLAGPSPPPETPSKKAPFP